MKSIPIHKVGFRAGLKWLPVTAELLFSGLGPLMAVASLWLLISLVASLIPLIGQLALMVLAPMLTAGLMVAFDRLRTGNRPAPSTLFVGWVNPGKRLALLGLGMWSLTGTLVAAAVLVGWLGAQIDPATLEAGLKDPEALAQALRDTSFGGGIVLALAIFLLVIASLFFAVPLVMFAGVPAMAAIRFSMAACLRNLPAMIGLLLAVMILAMGLGLILGVVVSFLSLALGQLGSMVSQLVFLVATLFFQILLAGVQYVAFSQVCGWTSTHTEQPDDRFEA